MAQSRAKRMAASTSDAAIHAATGKTWEQWRTVLDTAGAAEWPHPKIAAWVDEHFKIGGWWAQGVTVGYEQAIGRRQPGQRADGTFDVSVSRTVTAEVLDALDAIVGVVSERIQSSPDGESRTVRMPNARWKLEDGQRLQATVAAQKPGKVVVSLTHSKMQTAQALEDARDRMREWLAAVR
jgi:hypothetical protein